MSRRIGASDSPTRAQLLDAAEALMLEEGYAAVTSRAVGRKADISPQLVHYYFRSMDDLFLEVLRRRSEEGLAQFAAALDAERSLRTIWRFRTAPHGAAFNIEFAALANHRKVIRAEMARYGAQFRTMQLDAIATILAEHDLSPEVYPPNVVMLTLMGLSLVMAAEEALGVTAGHDETAAFVDRFLAQVERPTKTAAKRSRARR